jgi:hypothetical protein
MGGARPCDEGVFHSREQTTAIVETERHGQIMVIRMNRPERLNYRLPTLEAPE